MSENWRLLPYGAGTTADHIALSDALVRAGAEPSVWWHSTSTPTLIIGAGQKDPLFTSGDVVQVRRHAGGTAVLAADGVVGLDVFLRPDHRLADADILKTYRWLGQVWVDALRALDVDAHLVTVAEARGAAPPPETLVAAVKAACFGVLSPYEVAVGDRKVVGLAQVRRGNGVLLQAGFHRQYDAELLAALLAPAQKAALAAELRCRAAGLDEVARHPVAISDVMEAFARGLARREGVRLEAADWTDAEVNYAVAAGLIEDPRSQGGGR